jgi:hypothetical protein
VGLIAAQRLLVGASAEAFSTIIAITIVESVRVMTAAGPRVYYAMAPDNPGPAAIMR